MSFDNPHQTAIKRSRESVPAGILADNDLLVGRCLDYGCGYGIDAEILGLEMYDPHFHPELPAGQFDTIMCNYVLNVVEHDNEQDIIDHILSLLKPGGHAYLTVRRDAKGMDMSRQRLVKLNLPVVVETAGFCIYEVWN